MKNNKIIIYFIIILYIPFQVLAQISEYGLPNSFHVSNQEYLTETVTIYKIDKIDIDWYRSEDALMDIAKETPWRFGVNIDVSISNNTDGIWDTLKDGTKVWRIGIFSEGARSLNLTFDKYKLPEGGKLFIYNSSKTDILGAFTHKNNQEDEMFATTLIKGSEIIIEYVEPFQVEFNGELQISMVTHGYRSVSDFFKVFGASGSCNVNVACPQSFGWDDQIRSVCMLVTGGNGFCSGVLLNNALHDGTPYVLTASHCYSNPSTLVYWFNWESANCENPQQSPPYNAMSGSVLRARWNKSDFCLFQLLQTPPDNYNVFYAGWNRTEELTLTEKVVSIHHPSGDIKKISWADDGATTTSYLQNQEYGDSSHWRVLKWSDGTTTESGSSGSPLFDSNKRVIGQLHGGYASCINISSDWYGKLSYSWNGNNSPETRLKDWLDPEGTDIMITDGYDPSWAFEYDLQLLQILLPEQLYCSSEETQIIFVVKNIGNETVTTAEVGYIFNGDERLFQWAGVVQKGESVIITLDTIFLDYNGEYIMKGFVSNPNGVSDENHSNDTLLKSITVLDRYTIPFSEGFEQVHFPPMCWEQQYENGWINWRKNNGGQFGNPSNAFSGNWNAFIYSNTNTGFVTKLISPPLDLRFVTNPTVTFSHAQAVRGAGFHDKLNVYIKFDNGEEWILLEAYYDAIEEWKLQTVALPIDISSICRIAFEGVLEGGYGVCLDNVKINGDNQSVEKNPTDNPLLVYPNPATREIFIKGSFANDNYDVYMSDISGKLVVQYSDIEVRDGIIRIETSGISSGIYTIYIHSKKQYFVEKVLIQSEY